MSAILASILPDFSDTPPSPPPAPAARPLPWTPRRIVRTASPPQSPEEVPSADHAPQAKAPLQPMTVPEALSALQVLVAPLAAEAAVEKGGDPFANPWAGLKRQAPPPDASPAETPEERAALLAEAEARGRGLGLAEARAEAEVALAAEREGFAARMAEERMRWSESEAERLAAGFAGALRTLDADLTQRIGRLLVPVLTESLRRRAVDDLAQALGRLMADPNHAAIRVSGPEDLLADLGRKLGPLAGPVTFEPGDVPEVSVVADQTVMETQLAAWTRLLAAAVAEG